MHMAAPGQRYVPEPLNFAVMVLESVSASSQAPLAHSSNPPFTTAADWLKLGAAEQAADSANEGPLSMYEVLAREPGDAYFGTWGFQCSAITTAVEVVGRAADLCGDLAALPEILAPAQRALASLAGLNALPKVVVALLPLPHPHKSQAAVTSSQRVHSGRVSPQGTPSPQLIYELCRPLSPRGSHPCLLVRALTRSCTVSLGCALMQHACHAEPGSASEGGAWSPGLRCQAADCGPEAANAQERHKGTGDQAAEPAL